jgi:hypothetical protein
MDLFPYERRQLDCLDGELRAEEPGLASKFDVFSRLAREDGKPPAEAQFLTDGPWREAAFARQRLRRYLMLLAAMALAVLTAITVLGFT